MGGVTTSLMGTGRVSIGLSRSSSGRTTGGTVSSLGRGTAGWALNRSHARFMASAYCSLALLRKSSNFCFDRCANRSKALRGSLSCAWMLLIMHKPNNRI